MRNAQAKFLCLGQISIWYHESMMVSDSNLAKTQKFYLHISSQNFWQQSWLKTVYMVSSKSQPQNSSTFQDFFKAFLVNSRPLSTQILCILRKYFYIRDCKLRSVELFHIIFHDYDIILSPKRHSNIERGLHLVNNGSSSGWLLDDTNPNPLPGPMMTYEKSIANTLLEFTDYEIMASYQTVTWTKWVISHK